MCNQELYCLQMSFIYCQTQSTLSVLVLGINSSFAVLDQELQYACVSQAGSPMHSTPTLLCSRGLQLSFAANSKVLDNLEMARPACNQKRCAVTAVEQLEGDLVLF